MSITNIEGSVNSGKSLIMCGQAGLYANAWASSTDPKKVIYLTEELPVKDVKCRIPNAEMLIKSGVLVVEEIETFTLISESDVIEKMVTIVNKYKNVSHVFMDLSLIGCIFAEQICDNNTSIKDLVRRFQLMIGNDISITFSTQLNKCPVNNYAELRISSF